METTLVVFNSHGSYCACLVQRSGWTKDVDAFLHWLSSIQFSGGDFNEAATAEGLVEALMMFPPPSGQSQPTNDLKSHCILITASNLYSLPTPVYHPKLQNAEQSKNGGAQSESLFMNSPCTTSGYIFLNWESLTYHIGVHCSVSLPVVCPKQLPKIRALYNAEKLNPQSDLSIDTVKNTFYLVLISEKFVEACTALSHSATNMDRATVAPSVPVTGQPLAPVPSGFSSGQDHFFEPSTVSSMAAVPTFPHIPSVARPATQAISSVQTSSAPLVSQEMVTKAENAPDIKPAVGGMTSQLCTSSPGGATVNLLNNLSQVRQVMSSAALAGASSSGQSAVAMHIQQGITLVAGSGALVGTEQAGQSPAPNNAFSPPTTSIIAANLGVSQPMQGMNQGSHSGVQMMQSGISMNQNMMSGIGQGNVSSGTGIQQLGGSNSSAPNMQLSQQSSGAMQPSQSKYVKFWEGNLSGQRQRQPILITRLEGYRSASASDSLAANWPPTMQIVRLISQDHMNNKKYVGKADFRVFRAMSQHRVLGQLQDKKLCAVIQLPSQTILLSVSDKACRLIGMLFPGQQQQQHQLSQLQHHHQQQQTSPLNQIHQQTSPLNQMQQEQPQQMVGSMDGQAFAQAPGRSQQGGGGGGQPTMPGAGFMG
ncbi:hypothetical protein Bca52824_064123 [Brassica carinata]|uniref:Mediator of RNA polymerase II transcription subunit 25 n=1 Tax=Brassica carinata TaxID=52824 RepID=A0A8X7QKF0_BRACI|nr:hypothetical protein Bca52824_064123 [Brassica carinata]